MVYSGTPKTFMEVALLKSAVVPYSTTQSLAEPRSFQLNSALFFKTLAKVRLLGVGHSAGLSAYLKVVLGTKFRWLTEI